MDTRKIAVEYRMQHWAEIMQDRQASEESIKTYCQRRGIHPNTYYYWQRKLRGAAVDLATREAGALVTPAGWAVCTEEKSTPTDADGAVTIEMGQFRVTARPGVECELLTKVFRALESLC